MQRPERPDDFETRRKPLRDLSDEALHDYFWMLVDKITAPLIEEARTYTTPSIERSVLLRMGFSSQDAQLLVTSIQERGLLAHGAGRIVLELARMKGSTLHEAGAALLAGQYWDELPL